MDGFTRTEIKTSGARIVTAYGGSGPPLLLLHGNPFTHLSWHKFAPRLAREFTVVATDLRGYGDSEKPPSQPDHANYSFRAMAQDQVDVMASFGFTRFMAAGRKVTLPVQLLWGATGAVGRQNKPAEVWKAYASDIRDAQAMPCGHYLSEEAPEETYAAMRKFFTAG